MPIFRNIFQYRPIANGLGGANKPPNKPSTGLSSASGGDKNLRRLRDLPPREIDLSDKKE